MPVVGFYLDDETYMKYKGLPKKDMERLKEKIKGVVKAFFKKSGKSGVSG